MAPDYQGRSPSQRAHRSFWILLLVSVLAAGSLSALLAAKASPLTGLGIAASGTVLVGAVALTARVMVAMELARRRSRARRG